MSDNQESGEDSTLTDGERSGSGSQAGGDIHTGQINQPPGSDPAELRRTYLNRLLEQTGQISLLGTGHKIIATRENEARLNLGAVYTALLTLSPEHHERLLRGEMAERETRRLSALEQFNRHPRLVLLGDPGSGKSTFVNFVTLCLAGANLEHAQANLEWLTSQLLRLGATEVAIAGLAAVMSAYADKNSPSAQVDDRL